MARRSIPTNVIEADRNMIETLQDLHDYAPRDPAHSLAVVQQLYANLSIKQRERRRLREALEQLDGEIVELEHSYHDTVLGVKDEVIGQYGRNSPALKAVGLKPRRKGWQRSAEPVA